MAVEVGDFSPWLERWGLQVDGAPFQAAETGSRLLPVRAAGAAAMLKLGMTADEQRGSAVMAWWDGQGAAPVLAHDERALLMVRAEGTRSLAEMARTDDDGATRVICHTVADLHRPRKKTPPPQLPPLEQLFAGLRNAAPTVARLARAEAMAAELLASPCDPVVLHGDIHHFNILDFGPLGWLAIDPWGYVGERAYDYANILKNPDLATMTAPGRLQRQIGVICDAAGLEPRRLLQWVFAHCGLSAAWSIEDGRDPSRALAVMDLAATELGL
jgi:streptomycin 6-kinase